LPPPAPPIVRGRLQDAFAGGGLGVLVVVVLYFAQIIFIPVALAVFLTFLMAPVVDLLERWVGRAVAVVASVLTATCLLFGIGWMVTHQLTGLVETLGQTEYKRNINEKKEFAQRWLDKAKRMSAMFDGNTQDAPKNGDKPAGDQPQPGEQKENPAPAAAIPPVAVPSIAPTWLSILPGSLERVVEVLAQAALVVVLVVFMLLRREDMRNRVIRLIGHGRLTLTTMAIDDAAARISRFLFAQLIVNSCYGLVFSAGLWMLGVPYAFLWGFLAAVMRYVPYVGIWLAVLPPIVLSLAASPGWALPLWVVGMVGVLELVCANVVEPMLFGQSIGVSEVALLVSAAFWAWLWGPIGLVLSAPLTVCLVVLGKYVPQLAFFDILLGDAPALPARLMFYQRLLARDQDEAATVIEAFARTDPAENAYDEFLIPALVSAKRDRDRGDLAESDEQFIVTAVRETAEQLAAGALAALAPPSAPVEGPRVQVLGCPARDETDEMALRMFQALLDPGRWDLEVLPVAALAAELLDRVDQMELAAVTIAALPPGGLANTRYLCKRLRQRFPDLKITVGLWGLEGDTSHARELLAAAGADHVATTMLETRAQLTDWLPVFSAAAAGAEPQNGILAGR
jgi:predicted PurR-regulated permease PerM